MILVSVEPDGISSVLIEEGLPRAIDSFSLAAETAVESLPELTLERPEWRDDGLRERFARQTADSVQRLIRRGVNDDAFRPGQLVLAGSGAHIEGLAGLIGEMTDIPTVLSRPFASLLVDMTAESSPLTRIGAAFTTCFGLALRALED